MKQLFIRPVGFVAMAVILAGCTTTPTGQSVVAPAAGWEYWSASGPAQPLMPGTQMRIENGWEIVVFSISGPASDPYAVVTLRRPKK